MNKENNILSKIAQYFSSNSKPINRTYRHIESNQEIRHQINDAIKTYYKNPQKTNQALSELGIEHISNDSTIEQYGKGALDDQDYVFRKIGLAEFETSHKNGTKLENILKEDFPNLALVQVPQPNDIVAYMDKNKQFTNYGIVSKVTESSVIVTSQWKNSEAYKHPIGHVPLSNGNDVVFMRKRAETISSPKAPNLFERIFP